MLDRNRCRLFPKDHVRSLTSERAIPTFLHCGKIRHGVIGAITGTVLKAIAQRYDLERSGVTKILADALVIAALALAGTAAAEPCPGRPEALGTSRMIAVDAASTPQVGRKHFPSTLALADKEVVITFVSPLKCLVF